MHKVASRQSSGTCSKIVEICSHYYQPLTKINNQRKGKLRARSHHTTLWCRSHGSSIPSEFSVSRFAILYSPLSNIQAKARRLIASYINFQSHWEAEFTGECHIYAHGPTASCTRPQDPKHDEWDLISLSLSLSYFPCHLISPTQAEPPSSAW